MDKKTEEFQKKYKIAILVSSRDRHSELALLMQSLRTQSFDNWNLYILDESQTPVASNHFLQSLMNRLKLEDHYIKLIRNTVSNGVCYARQLLVDELNNIDNGENYVLRCDDDVILEPDYLFKLLQVIEKGYDMASGIVPMLAHPEFKRKTKFVKPVINKVEFNEFGDITQFGDDCGYGYLQEEIIKAHHFRTNLLYSRKINKKVVYEKGLSPVGFREESFLSLRLAWDGYTMGVHTGAIARHIQSPSGGCRYPNYAQFVYNDDQQFRQWAKDMYLKRGDPFGK